MFKIIYLISLFFLSSSPAYSTDLAYLFCSSIGQDDNDNLVFDSGWAQKLVNGTYYSVDGTWADNNEYFITHKPMHEIKMHCPSFASNDKSINKYLSVAGSMYQYPIIDPKSASKILFLDKVKKKNYRDILDYKFLTGLAYISHYAYRTERGRENKDVSKNNYKLKYLKEKYNLELIEGSVRSSEVAKVHVVAFVNKKKKYIVIGYKGTSNSFDFSVDRDLSLHNIKQTGYYQTAIIEADKLFKFIKNKLIEINYPSYNDYKIVLTGHSLGGYYASMVSVLNGGLPARVFSSPATLIKTNLSYKNLIVNAGYIPFYNVINFVRENDPIVFLSGRHAENLIYFSANNFTNINKNHSLILFINEIFETKLAPTYFYIYPTYSEYKLKEKKYLGLKKIDNYFGLKELISYRAYLDPNMIYTYRDKELISFDAKNFQSKIVENDFVLID